jgi:hypothetical protein
MFHPGNALYHLFPDTNAPADQKTDQTFSLFNSQAYCHRLTLFMSLLDFCVLDKISRGGDTTNVKNETNMFAILLYVH